jgi:hypothetical protein
MGQHLIGTQFQQLTVDLTPVEVAQLSQQLAELTTKQAQLEEEKKAVTSSLKERLDRVLCDARSCARKVTTKKDVREVECHILADYDTGRATTYRVDTWERLTDRNLTASERQQSLEFEEEEESAPVDDSPDNVPADGDVEGGEAQPVENENDEWSSPEAKYCDHPSCNSGRNECMVHTACPDFTPMALEG